MRTMVNSRLSVLRFHNSAKIVLSAASHEDSSHLYITVLCLFFVSYKNCAHVFVRNVLVSFLLIVRRVLSDFLISLTLFQR